MRRHSAAPEGKLGGKPRGSGFNGGDEAILPDLIPEHIRQRLLAEDIHTIGDWLALGLRRFEIFGVTRKAAFDIDELVREAST